MSSCEYGRCGTRGRREKKKPSWQAQLVLRIWAEKSPQTWKDWKVCEDCCDLMIRDLRIEEMGYEKQPLPKTEQKKDKVVWGIADALANGEKGG